MSLGSHDVGAARRTWGVKSEDLNLNFSESLINYNHSKSLNLSKPPFLSGRIGGCCKHLRR